MRRPIDSVWRRILRGRGYVTVMRLDTALVLLVAAPACEPRLEVPSYPEDARIIADAPYVTDQHVPYGDIDVEWLATEPAIPAAGSPFAIEFRLTSRASAGTDVALQPWWEPRTWPLALVDETGAIVTSLFLAQGTTRTVRARIAIPCAASGDAFVALGVAAGLAWGASGFVPFQVGVETIQPGPIRLVFRQLAGASIVDGHRLVLSGDDARVDLAATFSEPGTYPVEIDSPATGGWSVEPFLTPSHFEIAPGDNPAVRLPMVVVRKLAPSPDPDAFAVRLRQASTGRTRELHLHLGNEP